MCLKYIASSAINVTCLLMSFCLGTCISIYCDYFNFYKLWFGFFFEECPPLRAGSLVKGKINGKFENGYLVTANFGSETLNGILYLVSHQPLETTLPLSRKCGRKRSRKEADPSSLMSDKGGYNIFCAEQYSKLRPLYSGKEKVIVKHINSLWNNLVESEKEVMT